MYDILHRLQLVIVTVQRYSYRVELEIPAEESKKDALSKQAAKEISEKVAKGQKPSEMQVGVSREALKLTVRTMEEHLKILTDAAGEARDILAGVAQDVLKSHESDPHGLQPAIKAKIDEHAQRQRAHVTEHFSRQLHHYRASHLRVLDKMGVDQTTAEELIREIIRTQLKLVA